MSKLLYNKKYFDILILGESMAKLYFFYGAMNSGKTTRILQCDYNYTEKGMRAIIMKPATDTKGQDKIVSRIGSSKKVDYLINRDEDIFESIVNEYNHVDLILVDEAQFLTTRQVNQLMDIVIDLDIPVMCYGLRTDFKGNGFPGARRLLEIAHEITEIKTICECGKKAMFNVRLIDGKVVTEGESVAIDGEGQVSYTVACGKCFRMKTRKKFDHPETKYE